MVVIEYGFIPELSVVIHQSICLLLFQYPGVGSPSLFMFLLLVNE